MTTPDEATTSTSALKRAYLTIERMQRRLEASERAASEPIAVIGLGCRFPGGAVDADSYWDVLSNGVDAVTEIPADRWDVDAFFSETPAPGKMSTRAGGFLDGIDRFDYEFFGISRREAVFMDPQQRMTLEVAWEALENAGQAPTDLAGSRTGVFMGVATMDFATETLNHPLDYTAHAMSGFAHSVITGRLSYTLDLRGPSVAIDTACSSALVAVHQACQSLRAGDCDLAMGGGVNAVLSPLPSVSFSQFGRMVSVDGRCGAFDASANGYVRSEGCGVIVLKRLSDAARDGDNVLALLRGGAVNQDGRSAGLTAPNGSAQRDVLRRALDAAGVEPGDVSFIEAHGTGTRLGDPIEAEALTEVYGRDEGTPVYLGSSKTNIGHAEAAAGIAGLIKVVQSVERGAIPGNLHFERLNPDISFDGTTFAVPTALTPWPEGERRVAGVSAFGFSGTNAHLIVEAAPDREPVPEDDRRPVSVLALSAQSETALTELARKYRERFDVDDGASVPDLCFSANTGRSHLRHRLAVAGGTKQEIATRLVEYTDGEPTGDGLAAGEARNGDVVFLFTGQGVQRVGMARDLYDRQPTFRAAVDRCAEILRPMLETPLLSVIYPQDPDSDLVNETGYAQPALFAVEYAMAQLWRSWGIEPVAVLGHSFGEYVAATVAGAMSLEDGLRMAVERSRLMQSLADTGAMAAISAPELVVAEEIADCPDRISIAAVNGPTSTTISGEAALVAEICEIFTAREIRAKQLHITTSSHSPLIEPILGPLRAAAEQIGFSPPQIPLISNVSGQLWSWEQAPDADYWCRHARQPVRFATGVAALLGMGYRNFIEVGPAPTLLGLISDMLPPEHDALLLPSLRPKQEDWQILLSSVGQLYTRGGEIDWRGFDADYTRSRVTVPTYAFERTPCWREQRHRTSDDPSGWDELETEDAGGTGEFDDLDDEDLLYSLEWQDQADGAERPDPNDGARRTWLVLTDGTGVGDGLGAALTERGARCVLVTPGAGYHYDGTGAATVRRDDSADLERLLGDLDLGADEELELVHLWSLETADADVASAADVLRAQQDSCMSAVCAAQALLKDTGTRTARLWLVSRGAVRPEGTGPVAVLPATLWGLGRSLQQEHAAIWGGLIDLDPDAGPRDSATRLLDEITHRAGEDQIALRGDRRHVARLVRERQADAPARGGVWRRDAGYLITGGLGGVGLAMARSMASAGARRLILAGRTPLPPRAEWSALADDHPAAARVNAVRELESLGASVHIASLDVSDDDEVRAFLERYDSEGWPPIRGVVHAAGAGDVLPLVDLRPEALEWHLRGKALGAWVLHRRFADRPLDFMVFCSSTSSVLSSPFFGAYAAANAFLDSLAQQRRSEGKPGLSINWGIWRDTGRASVRDDDATPGMSRGMGTLRPGQALRVFHRLLQHDGAQVAVVPVDWSDWGRRYRDVSGSALLAELVDDRGGLPAARATTRRARLLPTREEFFALPEHERTDTLTDKLLLSVSATVDASSSTIGPDQPLFDMGVDSLMAVELKNEIEGGLGVSLPISAFLEGASVRNLVERITAHLLDEHGTDEGAVQDTGIQRVERFEDVATELLAQLEDAPGAPGQEAKTGIGREG